MDEYASGAPLRVALALAKPIERHGLRAALAEEDGIEIVAEVDDVAAAERAVVARRPDVIVLDCDLSESLGAGVDTVVRLIPQTAVLAFGPLDEECVIQMVAAGVSGYLYHGEGLALASEAVRACASGQAWYSPAVVPFLVQGRPGWPRHRWPRRAGTTAAEPTLTERQWEVLRLAAEGQANKEIAQALGLQRSTVEEHLSRVYAKLGLRGRAQAVRWYVEREMRGT